MTRLALNGAAPRFGFRQALAAAGMLAVLAASPAQAQTNGSGPAAPTVAPSVAPEGLRVLAIGVLTPNATLAAVGPVLEREVPATLRLYLEGHIDDWYVRTDRTGVVFILNVKDLAEAHALLDPLPLGQAGLMSFELIPLAPLQPLALLLHDAPSAPTAR